jgi:hypothetical protein
MQVFLRTFTKAPTLAQKLIMQPARSFNKSIKSGQLSKSCSFFMMGTAATGMVYLAYSSIDLKRNQAYYT